MEMETEREKKMNLKQPQRPSKKSPKNKPFTDYYGFSIKRCGFVEPETFRIPSEEYIKQMKANTGKESEKLRVLVGIYLMYIENGKSELEALKAFWNKVEEIYKTGYLTLEERNLLKVFKNKVKKYKVKKYKIEKLTPEERNLLIDAEVAGSIEEVDMQYIKAAQVLVKANPLTIHLPFVRRAMINVLREYRDTFVPKPGAGIKKEKSTQGEEKESSEQKEEDIEKFADAIRLKWLDFLPSKKEIPYSPVDMLDVLNTIIKKEKVNKEEAYHILSELLGIGVNPLKRRIRKVASKSD